MKIEYVPVTVSERDVSFYRHLELMGGPYLVCTQSDDEAREEIEAATAEFIMLGSERIGVVSFIHLKGSYNAELDFIAFYPAFRRKKIGTKVLLEKLEAYRQCIAGVSLTVHPENSGAIAFYESLGFKKEYPIEDIEDGPRWRMTWRPTKEMPPDDT